MAINTPECFTQSQYSRKFNIVCPFCWWCRAGYFCFKPEVLIVYCITFYQWGVPKKKASEGMGIHGRRPVHMVDHLINKRLLKWRNDQKRIHVYPRYFILTYNMKLYICMLIFYYKTSMVSCLESHILFCTYDIIMMEQL